MSMIASVISAGFDVDKVREDFPVLKQRIHGKPLVYLDSAATAQKPFAVIDAIRKFHEVDCANIHRGVHELSQRSTAAYEETRIKAKRFLNARAKNELIFVRGTTEGINLVASSWGRKNVKAGDEIVISTLEHHSNIVPWQMLCEEKGARLRVIPVDDRGELLLEEYEKLLGPRTRMVAVGHVSNALGTINPVRQIVEMAHRAGALALIDGAQAAPHLKIDVQALDADFYAFSGHKVIGPTGIGILYGKARLLNAMPPYQGGGDMIKSVTSKRPYTPTCPTSSKPAPQHRRRHRPGRGLRLRHAHRPGQYRRLRAPTAGLRHRGAFAHSGPSHPRHGAREGGRALVRHRRHPSPRYRHRARPPGNCRAHRPPLRAAGDGPFRRARHHRASLAFYNTFAEIDALAAGLAKVKEIFS